MWKYHKYIYSNKQIKERCNSVFEIKKTLETMILNDHMQNTGFLMWTACCIACINQKHSRLKHLFFLIVSYPNSDSSAIKQTKHINGTKTLVETISNVFNIQSKAIRNSRV